YVYFFFQAEDGIRDLIVTGVQTCALPIWSPASAARWPVIDRRAGSPPETRTAVQCRSRAMISSSRRTTSGSNDSREHFRPGKMRSEERRVGKEWRGRGWAEHCRIARGNGE